MSGRKEYPDPTPVEVPLGFKRPPTLQEEIQRIIRAQLSEHAQSRGFETFEEADDFNIDEDPDPLSPYEVTEMQQEAAFAPEVLDPNAVPNAPQQGSGAPQPPVATPVAPPAQPAQNGS